MPATEAAAIVWQDSRGNSATTRFRVLPAITDGDLEGVANDLQPMSDLRAINVQRTKEVDFAGTAANAKDATHSYADDLASLVLRYEVPTTGQNVFIAIPGPKQSLITENNLRIDPENAAFGDLNTAVVAAVTTAEGDAAGTLMAGKLNVAKTPRPR